MSEKLLEGIAPALLTPFKADGSGIDTDAVAAVVEMHINAGQSDSRVAELNAIAKAGRAKGRPARGSGAADGRPAPLRVARTVCCAARCSCAAGSAVGRCELVFPMLTPHAIAWGLCPRSSPFPLPRPLGRRTGMAAFYLCGSTGEGLHMNIDERKVRPARGGRGEQPQ